MDEGRGEEAHCCAPLPPPQRREHRSERDEQGRHGAKGRGLPLPARLGPRFPVDFVRIVCRTRDIRRNMHAAPLTEDFRQIDVRRWQRDGLLRSGTSFTWQWSSDGVIRAWINVAAAHHGVVLSYRYRRGPGEWQNASYFVRLVRTACHLGGSRPWFVCPAPNCGRRVAILYEGARFLCRRCTGLAYACTRETHADRAMRRTEKIRDRLGWQPGILSFPRNFVFHRSS
jgi:hypothetical protein